MCLWGEAPHGAFLCNFTFLRNICLPTSYLFKRQPHVAPDTDPCIANKSYIYIYILVCFV